MERRVAVTAWWLLREVGSSSVRERLAERIYPMGSSAEEVGDG